ncbi:MAG: type III pantothenate kinase [Bacteroidota bacterium]
MLLVIDIGNTHTVVGVYHEARLQADWRMTSPLQRTEDEAGSHLKLLLQDAGISAGDITGIGISSVVPNLTDVYAGMAEKYFHRTPVIIGPELDLGITIRYKDPTSVGADRLCNAVAGFARHGGPLIIVDFGTATTYDVVAGNGDYLGGVIAPGVETSAADLHRRAAKLPKIELRFPANVIGTETVGSMQAGILYGAVDALEGMIGRIQRELLDREKKNATVIATGGFASLMHQHTRLITAVEPTLVLEGIRLIYGRVETKTGGS